MRLEDLKKDMPEVPDSVHKVINEEVVKQVGDQNIVSINEHKSTKWIKRHIAAVAAICVIAVSTVAYAGSKIYHLSLNKQGSYSTAIEIQSEENEEKIIIPSRMHDIEITPNYIPDGMKWLNDSSKLEFKDESGKSGISIATVLMDDNDLSNPMLDKDVIESEEHTFGTHDGVYVKYQDFQEDDSFNQRIYLLWPEKMRVLIIYVGNSVSKEESYKFAENIAITDSDEMIETDKLMTWSSINKPEPDEERMASDNVSFPVRKVGEEFKLCHTYDDENGESLNTDKIKVCVDEVKIENNLGLLKNEYIPTEWKKAVDEKGILVKNHLLYIKKGDGINSLDQVVDEKNVEQKLIYVTVTYTNVSNEKLENILYIGSLMSLIKNDDGTFAAYIPGETSGKGYDYYMGDSVARISEMTYSDVQSEDGRNRIPSLEPDESIEIHMAWVVNEPDINNLYLNLDGNSPSIGFNDDIKKEGLVYIGQ